MSAQSGPALKKLPPYAMKASSKTEISKTPEGGSSSGSLYKGDYVTVIEERGENSRIKSKYGNGWIKTSCLQAPVPSETAP
ncbi:MAG: SH3 domain-containing protein [bacterium]|nr:SH3 domain-containing protein [bacterium]